MMIKRVCDRCGTDIIGKYTSVTVEQCYSLARMGGTESFDLCPDCAQKILDFLGAHKDQIKLSIEE